MYWTKIYQKYKKIFLLKTSCPENLSFIFKRIRLTKRFSLRPKRNSCTFYGHTVASNCSIKFNEDLNPFTEHLYCTHYTIKRNNIFLKLKWEFPFHNTLSCLEFISYIPSFHMFKENILSVL